MVPTAIQCFLFFNLYYQLFEEFFVSICSMLTNIRPILLLHIFE